MLFAGCYIEYLDFLAALLSRLPGATKHNTVVEGQRVLTIRLQVQRRLRQQDRVLLVCNAQLVERRVQGANEFEKRSVDQCHASLALCIRTDQ